MGVCCLWLCVCTLLELGLLLQGLHKTFIQGVKAQRRCIYYLSAMVLSYTVILATLDCCSVGGVTALCVHPVLCHYVLQVCFRPSYGHQDLARKVVLITGCDSGFGHKLARHLDKLGIRVVAGCLQADGGKGADDLRGQCSARLNTLRLDVADAASVQAALTWVKDNLKDDEVFWALVNNAGVNSPSELEFTPMDTVEKLMNVNCFGQLRMIQAFLPLLRASSGRVVNVASVVGKVAMYNLGAYCMSKFAVEAMSDVLRQEMRKWGVHVSVIEPGPYVTGIGTDSADRGPKYIEYIWSQASPEVKAAYGRQYFDAYKNAPKFCTETNLEPVMLGFEDAVLSPHPRRRYTMGSGSFYVPLLNTLCQAVLDRCDWLMAKNTVYPKATPNALTNKC